jgi:hypothetical protein
MKKYEFNYYCVSNSGKLVYGFDDAEEVKQYSQLNGYRIFKRNGLKNKKIDPNLVENWTDDYPPCKKLGIK